MLQGDLKVSARPILAACHKTLVTAAVAVLLAALLPTAALAQTAPGAEQRSGSQAPTPHQSPSELGVGGGLSDGSGTAPTEWTTDPDDQGDDADVSAGLDGDGILTYSDGGRDLSLQLLSSAEASSLAASVFGESLDGLAAAAAGSYDRASGDNGSGSGEAAVPSTWMLSDTGQLHLLVGGVVVEFDAAASHADVSTVFGRHGVTDDRISADAELPGIYFVSTSSDAETFELVAALSAEPLVDSASPNTFEPQELGPPERTLNGYTYETACSAGGRPWSDRLSNCLWHLDSGTSYRYGFHDPITDINIGDVWDTTKGEGVTAVVLDTALNHQHPDLKANVDTSKSYTNVRKDHRDQFHGTAVAGIIGARDNNIGGRGVAPRATLIDYPVINAYSNWREAQGLTWRKAEAAVYNMSYGNGASPGLARESSSWYTAIADGLENGFNGKGSVYVTSAGNGRGSSGNTPESGWTTLEEQSNHIGTIPVCAVASDGIASEFSERGPSLWVCGSSRDAYRGRPGVLTADYTSDYRTLGGTSAAAPVVSGVVALMRSANSDLTWRDVKVILAQTAQKVDAGNSSWELAGTHYGPSDGRYNFSNIYGFGLVDAKAAVDAALNWPLLPELTEWTGSRSGGHQDIPNGGSKLDITFDVATNIDFVEYIDLDLNLFTGDVRDYRITLTSPSGSTSLLSPEAVSAKCSRTRACGLNGEFTFGSSRHLGEDPSGTWTLTIDNKAAAPACSTNTNNGNTQSQQRQTCPSRSGFLRSWNATIHGHTGSDWITLSASPSRVSEGGTVTLTASVTGDVPAQDILLPLGLRAGTATAPGNPGADYGEPSPRFITIPPRSRSGSTAVAVTADSEVEPDETFTAVLNAFPSRYRSWPQPTEITVAGTPPQVSVNGGVDVAEGSNAMFTLNAANPAPAGELKVNLRVTQSAPQIDAAALGPMTVVIPSSGTVSVPVPTTDDQVSSGDRALTVAVESGSGYMPAASSTASVTVTDDDAPPGPEVSISAGADVEEGAAASYTLTASPAPTSAITVKVNITAAGSYGVTAGVRTVQVPTSGTANFTVDTTNDDRDEADGSATATVQAGTGYRVGTPSFGTVAIADNDDPPLPAVTIKRSGGLLFGSLRHTITEGGSRSFTVSADPAPSSPITVKLSLTETGDFGASGPATVTLSGANATYTVTTTDDNVDEPDGSVTVTVQPGQGYTVGSLSAASVNVVDDDDPPQTLPEVSISAGADVTEGTAASFTLSASPAPTSAMAVDVDIAAAGSYGVTTGVRAVTVPTSGSVSFTVPTTGDSVDEADGSVTATVQTGTGYTVDSSAGDATVAVADNDVPEVSISAGTDVTEGTAASFTLSASPVPHAALSVSLDVTAAGSFGAATGVRSITVPTSGSVSFTVGTSDDQVDEADGSVTVTVQSGQGYTVDSSADDATVAVADDDVTVTAAQHPLVKFAALIERIETDLASPAYRGEAHDLRRVLKTLGVAGYENYSGGAVGVQEATNRRTRPSDNPHWEGIAAAIEYKLNYSPTNPPPDPDPEISISAGSGVSEGTAASFTLSASPAPSSALTVRVDVTAAGSFGVTTGVRDVTVPTSGSVAFTVSTAGDGVDEADGSVTATVQAGTGYTVDSTADDASVAVADDDVPEISVTAGSDVSEGTAAWFTLSASPVPHAALSVSVDVTAAGSFGVTTGVRSVVVPTSGSVAFTVPTAGDQTDEPDGSVTATVQSGSGYAVDSSADDATVQVADDDPGAAAVPPLEKFAALVKSFYDRITATSGHGDGAGGGWNKRFLKAMGHPEYVSYPLDAVTVARAQELYDHGGPGANTAWEGTVEALEYKIAYDAGQVVVDPVIPPPDPDPEITISAGSGVTEGADASFTLNASPAPTTALTVKVDITASGSYGVATGVRNITVPTSGTATFTVPTTGDDTDEPNGSATATVQTSAGYTVGTPSASTVVIADNDDPTVVVPEITISAGSDVTEGTAAGFTLNASPAPTSAITVKVNITAAGDYGVATGVRNITVPTSGTATFTVPTTGDDTDEPDGSATATVQTGTGYTVGTPSAGTVAIADNDDPPVVVPEITISAGSDVTEGAAASFTLSASLAPTTALTVKVNVTAAGSYGVATGARDITVPTSGTVTFTVPTTGDDVDEPDGSATATVQTGAGYTVGTPSAGTVAIADNDDPPKKDDPKAGFVASIEQLRDDYSAYENWATGTFHQYMVHYSSGEILALLNADTPPANSVSNQALFFRAIRAAKGTRDSDAAALFAKIRDHYKIKKIG